MEFILTRRSIRKYTAEPVAPEDVEDLLRAAMSAPSARNEQPWHFIVITEQEVKEALMEMHPYAKMLVEAPVAILVCGDKTLETSPGYWMIDCSAATQNILLAAHSKGLGAVWLGVYPRQERMEPFAKLMGLPEHVIPFSLVALGHPAEEKPPADRFNPERIRYNRW
ncbi:MAG: nitroreductase family protein [Firmicutes bacterium]|nr:nitroreductase family protein [Bacillota bacterium]